MNIEQSLKHIRNGWIIALIAGFITLIFNYVSISQNFQTSDIFGFYNDPFIIFDIVLVFSMAFGIYKKSRICALIMLLHYLLSKLVMINYGINFFDLSGIISLVFIYFYVQAVRGTITYHKLIKNDEKKTLIMSTK